jgi:hypothetical protein
MDSTGFWLFIVAALVLTAVLVAAIWRVFEKAGQPGWGCLIPIYNLFLLVRIGGKPDIWVLLLLIPAVGFIVGILLAIEVAKRFGQGTGFGVGLALLPWIFYPILGFGDARYGGIGAQVLARPA